MPVRKIPLINGAIYHVFNHGIDYRDICNSNREYQRLLLTLWFYQPETIQIKLSHYLSLPSDLQIQMIKDIISKPKAVEIHAYCLMPNHYHLLIKQLTNNGISKYLANLQNSYTKYFNSKHKRRGSLFLTPFRSKHISSESQCLHVSRYIHLNRYSSGLLKTTEAIKTDPLTSFSEYYRPFNQIKNITTSTTLSGLFKSIDKHWDFINNQADYQRQLDHIKHLIDE